MYSVKKWPKPLRQTRPERRNISPGGAVAMESLQTLVDFVIDAFEFCDIPPPQN